MLDFTVQLDRKYSSNFVPEYNRQVVNFSLFHIKFFFELVSTANSIFAGMFQWTELNMKKCKDQLVVSSFS